MAVGFWNFTGAGIFGFLINMPIVSYFEMGTNLTPTHGHAAMMGVFGMLAIALMVFVLRQTTSDATWPRLERYIRCGFWGLNIGLAMMVVLSLFPAGILQLHDVITTATGTRAASPIRRAPCRGCSNGCGCRATWCSSSWARCRSRSHCAWAISTCGRGARRSPRCHGRFRLSERGADIVRLSSQTRICRAFPWTGGRAKVGQGLTRRYASIALTAKGCESSRNWRGAWGV